MEMRRNISRFNHIFPFFWAYVEIFSLFCHCHSPRCVHVIHVPQVAWRCEIKLGINSNGWSDMSPAHLMAFYSGREKSKAFIEFQRKSDKWANSARNPPAASGIRCVTQFKSANSSPSTWRFFIARHPMATLDERDISRVCNSRAVASFGNVADAVNCQYALSSHLF